MRVGSRAGRQDRVQAGVVGAGRAWHWRRPRGRVWGRRDGVGGPGARGSAALAASSSRIDGEPSAVGALGSGWRPRPTVCAIVVGDARQVAGELGSQRTARRWRAVR